jgi:hypothetical protein
MTFKFYSSIAALTSALLLSACAAHGQNAPRSEVAGIPVNYDESRVGGYALPDPLKLNNGAQVRDAKTWIQKRRPEIVRLFEENQFGRSPGRPAGMSFDVFDKGAAALDGKALRKQVTVYFSRDKAGPKMDLLIYLPAGARKPVPLLLNLSFSANMSVVDDPGVKPGEVWNREKKRVPATRGSNLGRLNVAPFLAQGIGVATVYYGDIDPDFQGGIPYGARSPYLKSGQTEPAPDEWGAIAAWAWGLSRAMDYLETDKEVDAPWKDRALGGRSRRALRDGHSQLFGRGRRGVEQAQLRRDDQTSDRANKIPISVFRQLPEVRRPGRSVSGGLAHADCADRATASVAANRRY